MNTGLVIVNTIDTCQGEKEVRERRKEARELQVEELTSGSSGL